MKTNKKNICIVRHGYYPIDARVYKEVRALVEAGYNVDVICLRGENAPGCEVVEGVRVYRMLHTHRRGSVSRYVFEYLLSILMMGIFLPLLFFKRRYSCIQVNTLPDSLVFITLLPRLLGARILLDMHEPSPELLLTKYGNRASENMLHLQIFIEKYAIRYAHQVITVNDIIRQRFIERGADPNKIAVVRNVPPDDFEKTVPVPEPHKGLVIITHGTLQPRYGQNVLLHALPLIRPEFNPLQVIVAGAGETLEELKELSAELNCADLVTFTGLVSRERIAELISGADIGIVPLIPGPFSELCQPNKLFEYIALKVPAVAARLPAMEESFDDTCVRFFRPGDAADLAEAVIQLGRNASLRKSLAEHAFARYQDLCWSKAKKQYVDLVDSLTGNPLHAE